MRIGFLEPHLERVGGIRRIVEFSNRLVDRGHDVTIFVPDGVPLDCDWLPCRARIRPIWEGGETELDVLVFNHEPQWRLLRRFPGARRTVFYALHYGRAYRKPGSWESLRSGVDLVLANSSWTAEMIEAETGRRPPIVLGGISSEYFHPVEVEKRYPLLCPGDDRPWKGTAVAEEAARLLGLPLERYEGKNLPQSEMAVEYCRAQVFAVGSVAEGFGWPGLEALACGVPLATTDNGGCREYAVDGETALLVPPNDAQALADAIARLRDDRELAERLRGNGLALVREKFDWERATDELERQLGELVEAPKAPSPWRPGSAAQRLRYAASSHRKTDARDVFGAFQRLPFFIPTIKPRE